MQMNKNISIKENYLKLMNVACVHISIPDNKMYLYQVVHVVMDAYVIHLSAASRRVAIER